MKLLIVGRNSQMLAQLKHMLQPVLPLAEMHLVLTLKKAAAALSAYSYGENDVVVLHMSAHQDYLQRSTTRDIEVFSRGVTDRSCALYSYDGRAKKASQVVTEVGITVKSF